LGIASAIRCSNGFHDRAVILRGWAGVPPSVPSVHHILTDGLQRILGLDQIRPLLANDRVHGFALRVASKEFFFLAHVDFFALRAATIFA
jgi:hypothetical protein